MLLVGDRLAITGCWDDTPTPPGRETVCLQPSQAWGNGYHPSTRRLLDIIERELRPSDVVYDIGTGSGILALAAARLGASYVYAVERNQRTLASAVVNVEANNLTGRISVSAGIPHADRETVDLILCNIGGASGMPEILRFAGHALSPDGFFALVFNGDLAALDSASYRLLPGGPTDELSDGSHYIALRRSP